MRCSLQKGVLTLLAPLLALSSDCPVEQTDSAGGGGCGCATNRARTEGAGVHESPSEKYSPELNSEGGGFARTNDMLPVPGGTYEIGTDSPVFQADREGPIKKVDIKEFWLDVHEVSNDEFGLFVKETKYVTEAETFGNSFVAEFFLSEEVKAGITDAVAAAPWWLPVDGASWLHPEGPDSSIEARGAHPVVHVSWNDARAFCSWAGKRLPSETEWEAACRAGKEGRLFPWGNNWTPGGQLRANIWQGDFPDTNTGEDGFLMTSPVTEFPASAFGHKNMIGNVWEWVEDLWVQDFGEERTKKGGSFMCHKSYCYRYRCAARSQNTPDSSAHNLGFRCAADRLPDYLGL